MRRETITVTHEYTMFDPGEKVRPHSDSTLPDGIYTVRQCLAPSGLGGDESGTVFLEGKEFGQDAERLLPPDHSIFNCYRCGKYIPIGKMGYGACPDCRKEFTL
jgi:hypothetical protein